MADETNFSESTPEPAGEVSRKEPRIRVEAPPTKGGKAPAEAAAKGKPVSWPYVLLLLISMVLSGLSLVLAFGDWVQTWILDSL